MFGRSNADVQRVDVVDSTTPFIIVQLFTTFENLEMLIVTSSELSRIQPNAFANATNLKTLAIGENPLRSLDSQAFADLTQLTTLSLFNGDLESIDERSFEGLQLLEILFLSGNKIAALPRNVFRSLENLFFITLERNLLESLHGDTFANNRNVQQISLEGNKVNALGGNFLDNLPRLSYLNMEGNRCVSGTWGVNVVTPKEEVLRILQPCFDNYVEDGVKIFTIELRGSLVLRDQSGNEILRLWNCCLLISDESRWHRNSKGAKHEKSINGSKQNAKLECLKNEETTAAWVGM